MKLRWSGLIRWSCVFGFTLVWALFPTGASSAIDSGSPAGCGCCTDPNCSGAFDIPDFLLVLNRAHRGTAGAFAPGCPMELTDITCDGCTDIMDVIRALGLAFQGEAGPGCDGCDCLIDPPSCLPIPPGPGGAVVVESKTVLPGAIGVTVGICITNDVAIQALVLPLEFRSINTGSFTTGSLVFSRIPGGRVDLSPLGSAGATWPAAATNTRYYPGVSIDDCSGPISNSYSTGGGVGGDFVSPDGFLHTAQSVGSAAVGDDVDLDPGSDPLFFPSYQFTFDVTADEGSFEIDTCCVTPCNHLLYIEYPSDLPFLPSFVKGTVVIAAAGCFCPCAIVADCGGTACSCPCPCRRDPFCDGTIVDVLDVVESVNVAFRNAPLVFDPPCPYERTDVDCDTDTDVIDVTLTINVAFRSAPPPLCATPARTDRPELTQSPVRHSRSRGSWRDLESFFIPGGPDGFTLSDTEGHYPSGFTKFTAGTSLSLPTTQCFRM